MSKIRNRRRSALFAAVTATATLATATVASAFGTTVPCTSRSESTVFSRWGDNSNYFLAPNGGFESGKTDWQLSGGAGVVSGNETFFVRSSGDSKSLKLPYGSTAESRTICVSKGEDTIRLFVNNGGVKGSILHVEVIARNPQNGAIGTASFDVNGDSVPAGWSPTMRLTIPNLLGGDGTQELTLRFSTRGSNATWLIDDVYVDPFKSV